MKLKRMAGAAAVLLLLAVCTGALAADTGIITADGVNLRESPDKESNAIGTLELGSEVEVLAVENGWYRIMLKAEPWAISARITSFQILPAAAARMYWTTAHIYAEAPARIPTL